MSTIIKLSDIRKGDKIKVTWRYYDVEYTRTGVANLGDSDNDWMTLGGIYLTLTSRGKQVVELLERPKTVEEILAERRDKLASDFSPSELDYRYRNLSDMSQNLINHIIELEDEKEALERVPHAHHPQAGEPSPRD